jgi:hypothetical protein
MRTIATLAAGLLLSACASDPVVVTSTKYRVVMPEEGMFTCDTVSRFPEPRTLTDLQVARLLVDLHQNNIRCRNSMQAIREFLEDAKIRIEEGREPHSRTQPVETGSTEQPRPRRVPIR